MNKILLVLTLPMLLMGCARLKSFGYRGFNRDKWQYPQQVIAALTLNSGDQVADIGAGGGYFTFKLAAAVGSQGKVYAVDVDPDMTAYLESQVRKKGSTNIGVIKGELDDPLLPDSTADLIFICNTYHHIADRVDYFRRLKRDLKPAGRVAIIELRPGSWWFKLIGKHWTEKANLLEEMESAGYFPLEDHDFLPRQHFLLFGIQE